MEKLKLINQYIEANYPESSIYHREAFKNSVIYLVEGYSSGSGPSIREHLCSWALVGDGEIGQVFIGIGKQPITAIYPDGRLPRAGMWEIARAMEFCSPICFGNLSRLALRVVVQEYCFDDDPKDLELIKKWELDELKQLRVSCKRKKLKQQDYLRMKYLSAKHS